MAYMLTAAVHREEDWYVARCLEIEVASRGPTIEEAKANLAEAVQIYLEETHREPESTPLVTPFQIETDAA